MAVALVFSLVKKKRELPDGYAMKAKKSLAKVRRSANLAFSETQRAKIGVLQKMKPQIHAEVITITFATCFAHISKAALFSAPKS